MCFGQNRFSINLGLCHAGPWFVSPARFHARSFVRLAGDLTLDGFHFLGATIRSRSVVSAEVLFLRKQLALYQEHQISPRRPTDSARFSLVFWSRLFDWKDALVIVMPETLIGWHGKGFKLFWRWKCRVGRPRLPRDIRQLIVRMMRENPTWGEERVPAELSVKLRILVSPRTVRPYWPSQFREAFPGDHHYRFLIHDRDSIFSVEADDELKSFGLKVLRTPVQAPKANAFCERLIGTVRRQCMDYLIPLGEKHPRKTPREWVSHYNQGRRHSALGPGSPADAKERSQTHTTHSSARVAADARITTREILGGLHHEYELERNAA
jgi:hypothetical protein